MHDVECKMFGNYNIWKVAQHILMFDVLQLDRKHLGTSQPISNLSKSP